MSFGVSCQKTGFEYSSRGLGGLFAQKSNWLRLRHYRFLREILRFNREAPKVLDDPAGATMTLGEWTRANDFSEDFSRYYLYPMAAAVWSTSLEEIEDFPAVTLVRFFANHGFLGHRHPSAVVRGERRKQPIHRAVDCALQGTHPPWCRNRWGHALA